MSLSLPLSIRMGGHLEGVSLFDCQTTGQEELCGEELGSCRDFRYCISSSQTQRGLLVCLISALG